MVFSYIFIISVLIFSSSFSHFFCCCPLYLLYAIPAFHPQLKRFSHCFEIAILVFSRTFPVSINSFWFILLFIFILSYYLYIIWSIFSFSAKRIYFSFFKVILSTIHIYASISSLNDCGISVSLLHIL